MKNKSTMILVGIGIAYLLYRLYGNKNNALVKTSASATITPNLLYSASNQIETNRVPKEFLVDDVRTAELVDTPDTYQSFYGNARLTGAISKVPSTC